MLQVLPHDEAQPEPKMNRRRLLGANCDCGAASRYRRRARWPKPRSRPGDGRAQRLHGCGRNARASRDIAEHARHHLLDTLALIISGLELPPRRAAQRYIRAFGGAGVATIAAVRLTAPPAEAALANGIMAHADETDDSHNASRSHPGCTIAPAALALAKNSA
jgi:2-methylcitrate dehydratase MmgE/PrpD-like protein